MKLSDLTLIQILGIILVVNGALSGAVNELTDLLGPTMAKHVLSITVIGSGICGGFITMFGGLGSQVKNVLAMPGVEKIDVNGQASSTLATIAVDPLQNKIAPTTAAIDKVTATAKAAAAVILLALVLMSLFTGDAHAQTRPLTGNIARDIATATGKPVSTSAPATAGIVDHALTDFNTQIQKITKEIVDFAIADVTAAQTDATNHNDQISKPCWDANLALLKSLPTQWENPPKFPVGLALGIQIQRDLLNSITGNDATSLKVACAALWGDQLKIVANLGALLGVRIATGGLL